MRLTRFFTATIRRKILSSFIVVIVLVLLLAVATYTQLELVRNLSRQVNPSSLRLTALQDYALSMSDFESNLDRYFVIGGLQFQESMRDDIERMNDALEAVGVGINPEMRPDYNELLNITQQLETEIAGLIELGPSELSAREANERVIAIFSLVEAARNLQQELAKLTSTQLQELALDQETLISSVIIQTLVFAGIVLLLVVVASALVTRSIARPLAALTEAAQQVEQGNLDVEVPVVTRDEVGQLAQTFNNMAGQLRNTLGTLEQQVEERTRGLAIVGSISEHLTGILNIDQLLDEVVVQVKDNFNYYHVHIYLFDPAKDQLVVVAGSGEAGVTMKTNRHSINANAKSLVARAARTGSVVGIANVREVADWLPNPLLPKTRSEVAAPIVVEGEVVGVLDVQEDEAAAFDDAAFDLLRSLANQLAIALRNARQFEQVQAALTRVEAVQEQYLATAWDREKLKRFSEAQVDVQLASAGTETVPVLNTPIQFKRMTIGNLELEAADPQRVWSQEELALVNAIADQVAQTAENLRLFDETRERAGREATIREITDKLRAAPNLKDLVQTASEELGTYLSATHLKLKLGVETPTIDDALAVSNTLSTENNNKEKSNGNS